MTKKNGTKRSLLMSAVALVLCFSMLVGSTFAWFTDSVTSSGNIIKSGNLDVTMEWMEDFNGTWKDVEVTGNNTIFSHQNWEPGYVDVKYVKIANEGSLAFNYQLHIIPSVLPVDGATNLADVIDVYFANTAVDADRNLTGLTKVGTLSQMIAEKDGAAHGVLYAAGDATGASEEIVTIALKMQESAGNEYQELSVGDGFKVQLIANQLTYEEDSFGSDYDTDAEWPVVASGSAPVVTGQEVELTVYDLNNPGTNPGTEQGKIAVVKVPAAAVASDTEGNLVEEVKVTMTETKTNGNITVAAGSAATTYDITVEGIKEGNTTAVKVMLFIGEGLDPATVKMYHYDTEIPCDYDPTDGYVNFETTSFSPFTVVYDANSEYVAPEVPEDENGEAAYPKAIVNYAPDYVGEGAVEWGSYGQWSPTEGLDSALEAAFTFTCPDYENATAEEKAIIDAYRYWYCDFYVSLDRALGKNQIFLGGYYASFDANVGFHNGEMTLEANEEIPLLGSVISNGWTYNDVETSVGTFVCGVGDVDDALDGATFTVKLRLTNPEDETEFYNVNVVTHTFGGNSVIDGVTVGATGN